MEKYRKDLELIRQYYFKKYTNAVYHKEVLEHEKSYKQNGGAVFGGNYSD